MLISLRDSVMRICNKPIRCRTHRAITSFILGIALIMVSFHATAEVDEVELGKPAGYPKCKYFYEYSSNQKCRVHSFSNPVGLKVQASVNKRRLKAVEVAPPEAKPGGEWDRYFASQRATSMMVLKNGEIIYENYQYDRNSRSSFRSFSMAKTITGMLIGIALEKGHIKSLQDAASDYVPAIKDTLWGDTKIESLLRMASGVKFSEASYGPDSDVVRWTKNAVIPKDTKAFAKTVSSFNERAFPEGTHFNYASPETSILAHVLRGATKRTVAELTKEWLWGPIGAQDDAHWAVAPSDGVELGDSAFYATLRDWGKIGVLLANDGKVGDTQVVPYDFLMRATDPKLVPDAFKPRVATPFFGYGYQTWLFPNSEKTFALIGVYGQAIFVQPKSKLVFVQTSVFNKPKGDPAFRDMIGQWTKILQQFGGVAY